MIGRPNSVYVVREDPVNPKLLYVGTELGVSASLDKGGTWFPLESNLPTVPVYDLQVHPGDLELIAGTTVVAFRFLMCRRCSSSRVTPWPSQRICSSLLWRCNTASGRWDRNRVRSECGAANAHPAAQ